MTKAKRLQSQIDCAAMENLPRTNQSRLSSGGERSISISGNVTGGLIHSGDVILQGIRALSPDYAVRIENFLVEYRGDVSNPVPFGGRENELQMLSKWVANSSTPPYLLLAAPAGRGKSALLVHWLDQLNRDQHTVAGGAIDIVFVPVSIRFRTNLEGVVFASLAAQLAHLRGERPLAALGGSAEVWRATAAEYLLRSAVEGRRLLVVLDGVDEAADWSLGPDIFPLTPPGDLRVVVSTRLTATAPTGTAWLNRLGWSRPGLAVAPPLDALNVTAINDVIQKTSVPLGELASSKEIARELFRLTKGDPLLIRLYVRDLWAQGGQDVRLRLEDLESIKPGLSGYLERWWQEQRTLWGKETPLREPAVQAIINLLAVASGPLRRLDLLQLVPIEAGLNALTFDDFIQPLDRFIAGDPDNGYSFTHPLLGIFFAERMPSSVRDGWDTRLVDWAEAAFAATEQRLSPKEVPPYAVQFLGVHLQRVGAGPERIGKLVSKRWADAWQALEGGFAGFLTDVDRAAQAAQLIAMRCVIREKPVEHVDLQLLCAFTHATIRSLASRLTAPILDALVDSEIWSFTQALAYARQNPNPRIRVEALLALSRSPHSADADTLLEEAFANACIIRDLDERFEMLELLGPVLPESLSSAALDQVARLGNEHHAASLLTAISSRLAVSTLERVLSIICKFQFDGNRALVLNLLAKRLPLRLREEAESAAEEMTSILARIQALAALAATEDGGNRKRLITKIHHLEIGIQDTNEARIASVALAPLVSSERLLSILREAIFIKPMPRRNLTLVDLAQQLRPEHYADLFETIQQIPELYSRVWILSRISPALVASRPADVLSVAREAQIHPQHCAVLLRSVLGHVPEQYIPDLLRITMALPIRLQEVQTLAISLIRHLPVLRPVISEWVLQTSQNSAIEICNELAIAIAPHVEPALRAQLLHKVEVEFIEISDEAERAFAYTSLWRFLPAASISQLLNAAESLAAGDDQLRVWIGLLPRLEIFERSSLVERVFTLIRVTWDEELRSTAINIAAPFLGAEQLQTQVARICEVINPSVRLGTLSRLLPFVPLQSHEAILAGEIVRLRWLTPKEDFEEFEPVTNTTSRAEEIEEGRSRSFRELIRHLGPYFSKLQIRQLLALASEFHFPNARLSAWEVMLPFLEDAEVAGMLPQIGWGRLSAQSVEALAPKFAAELVTVRLTRSASDTEELHADLTPIEPVFGLSGYEDQEDLNSEFLATLGRNDAAKVSILLPFLSADLRNLISDDMMANLPDQEENGNEKNGWEMVAKYGVFLLTEKHLDEFLHRIDGIASQSLRANVLLSVIPRLSGTTQMNVLAEALETVAGKWTEWGLTLLPNVLELLTPEQVTDVRAQLADEPFTSLELLSISPSLVDVEVDVVVRAAIEELLTRSIYESPGKAESGWHSSESDRRNEFSTIIKYLSPATWSVAWETSVIFEDPGSRNLIHKLMAQRIRAFTRTEQQRVLMECLNIGSKWSRPVLLDQFPPLAEIIGSLSAPEQVLEGARAITRVGEWWP